MTSSSERESTARDAGPLGPLIERARSAVVVRAAAEHYVEELDRWARPAAPVRRWVPWPVAGLAAAALVLGLWWRGGPAVAPSAPVWIGERVAIVAAAGTVYRVVRADAGSTEIAVDRGAITARLWRVAASHHLVLSGEGVTATATGTVYRLAIALTGPEVDVTEGTVEVRTADGVHVVAAGATWPGPRPPADPEPARTLLALPAPAAPRSAVDAMVDHNAGDAPTVVDAGADDDSPPPASPQQTPPPNAARPPVAIKDRWRTARLARAQGRFAVALDECLAIADAHDPMWSPIALVEAARIELGPLADPERAIAIADRMIREWSADMLASEARELRCRALRQLGRAGECATATLP